jgi:hypothetical protein
MAGILNPRVVTNGLTLALDAADENSYPRTGTTWADLTGNGNNGILTNGPIFSYSNGGNFSFDGTNDYVQTNFSQNTDNALITWECWFWDNSAGGFTSNTALISNYGASATTPYTSLHVYDNGNVFFGQRNSSGTESLATYSVNICDGIWHHIVGVVDSVNTLIYVDGILRASQAKVTGTTTSGQNIVIAGNHVGRYQSCRIASAKIYSRALTAVEVLQNYNAVRTRFLNPAPPIPIPPPSYLYYSDGSSFTDWTQISPGNLSINATTGNPAPSIRINNTAAIYRDFTSLLSTTSSPNFTNKTILFDILWTGYSPGGIIIGANSSGVGGLAIKLGQPSATNGTTSSTSWTAMANGTSAYTFNNNQWYTIRIQTNAGGVTNVSIAINGIPWINNSAGAVTAGNFMGFTTTFQYTQYIDNIYIKDGTVT